MRISAHIIKQPHLRTGTTQEREVYRYALRLERGIRRSKVKNVQQRIIQA